MDDGFDVVCNNDIDADDDGFDVVGSPEDNPEPAAKRHRMGNGVVSESQQSCSAFLAVASDMPPEFAMLDDAWAIVDNYEIL